MPIDLNPKVFAILTALIEERTGLAYALRDQGSFGERLGERLREAGFASALDYYYYLRYDPTSARELDALIDALVVTETYFFREVEALRALVEEILAPIARSGRRPRVWSAACASGEEPLTIAMLLEEEGLLERVEVVASDISLKALERARERGWSPRALRAMPVDAVKRWIRADGEHLRVDEHLVRAIRWRRVNLVDAAQVEALGSFDVIVCRNVFIYFSDATIRRVVGLLANALRPNGRLVVGASESLLRFGTTLECEERGGGFFYRRAR